MPDVGAEGAREAVEAAAAAFPLWKSMTAFARAALHVLDAEGGTDPALTEIYTSGSQPRSCFARVMRNNFV